MTREDVRLRLLVAAEEADQYEAVVLRHAARWIAEGYDLIGIRDGIFPSVQQGDVGREALCIVNQAVWEGVR